jgi:hypothetical protein
MELACGNAELKQSRLVYLEAVADFNCTQSALFAMLDRGPQSAAGN